MKLSLFYVLSPPVIFLTSFIFAIIKSPAWIYWFFLVLYVILNAASFPVRGKGYTVCVMREACPGSAAKSNQTS